MTSHICLVWRGLSIKQQLGEKNKWTERKMSIQCTQTHKLTSISSSHVQSYFIQKSTAITVSSHRQSWMCNFLHLLGSWQFDNQRTATAVLATRVLPLRQCLGFSASQACLDTHFCHSLPLPSLSCLTFIVAGSVWFSSQKSQLSPHTRCHSPPMTVYYLKCIKWGFALTFSLSIEK